MISPPPSRTMAPSIDCSSISLLCCEEVIFDCFSDEGDQEPTAGPHVSPPTSLPDILELEGPSHAQAAFSALLDREIFHMPSLDYLNKYTTQILDAVSRENAIDWLFKVTKFYNFNSLTAFLSVNFLDRFLSRHQLPKGRAWMTQLLSVACLSLAAKMEETDVPLLLDLQVDPGFIFESRAIQRMELLVLSALEWRVSSVTPFSYIGYFIHKLGLIGSTHQHILCSKTSEFLLSAVKELRFLGYRPSSIALAAVLCAMQSAMPLKCSESKKTLMSMLPADLQDSSERCYRLMAELFLKQQCLLLKDEDHRTSLVPQSPIGVLEASFSSTSDSESTSKCVGMDPSSGVSSQVLKKRRVDDFCSSINTFTS